MNLLIALSYLAMTLSIYGLVRIATGSRLAAIVAPGLLLATPAIWTPFVQQGLYTRVLGMGFASVAVVAATIYLRRPTVARYLLCLVAGWGALNSHVVLGALAVLAGGLGLPLLPGGDGEGRPPRALLLLPPGLLSAFYYLPLAFYSQSGGQLTAAYPALGLADLVSPTASYFSAPLVPLLPVTLIVLIAWVRFRSRQTTAAATRLIFVCGLVSGALLLYALAPLPRVSGLRSYDMLFFLGWFLAAVTGLALGSIKIPAARWKGNTGAAALVAATLVAIVAVFPFVTQTMVRNAAVPQAELIGWQPVDPTDSNFRIASPSDNLSVWLNAVYDVPQTGGYGGGPQITNPDWQFWFDSTAWNGNASEAQRQFLFDWYAVKWIYVPAPYMSSTAGVLPRLTAHTELYAAVPSSSGAPSLTFSYLRPTRMTVATNAPTFLGIAQAL